jgi:hypothetical protein
VAAFCQARDWDQFHNAKDLAIGIVTEAGEQLGLFRHVAAAFAMLATEVGAHG